MPVYILIDGEGRLLGAFSSQEKAKEYFRSNNFYSHLDLYTVTLDDTLGMLVTRLERKDL